MKLKNIFSEMILLILVFSCEKNNNINRSEIIVGEYNNMEGHYYDTIIMGSYNCTRQFNIDIDNDSNDDLQLESVLWGSPNVGQIPKLTIRSLNENVQIYGLNKNDTSFLNRDRIINNGPNNTVNIFECYNYTCHQIDEGDSVLKITTSFKVLPLNRGDTLRFNDTYKSDTITLIEGGYNLIYQTGENGDTITFGRTTYYNDCNEFPLDEQIYIGLKFKNESKLGWIKLSIRDMYIIFLYESGMQK